MIHIYDKKFVYTQVKDQGPNYLAEKFKAIREKLPPSNVKPLKVKTK